MQPERITRRAEQIREATGMPWEYACLQAERERDSEQPHPCEVYGKCRLSDQERAELARDAYYSGTARRMVARDTGREHDPGSFRGTIAFYAYTAQSAAARRRAAAQLPDLTPRPIPGSPRHA